MRTPAVLKGEKPINHHNDAQETCTHLFQFLLGSHCRWRSPLSIEPSKTAQKGTSHLAGSIELSIYRSKSDQMHLPQSKPDPPFLFPTRLDGLTSITEPCIDIKAWSGAQPQQAPLSRRTRSDHTQSDQSHSPRSSLPPPSFAHHSPTLSHSNRTDA